MLRRSRISYAILCGYTFAILAFLYVPLLPIILFSLSSSGRGRQSISFTPEWYARLLNDPLVIGAAENSLIAGIIVACVTTPLALLGAMALRQFGRPELVLVVMLLPVFIPGISMGVALSFFLRVLRITPSILTIVLAHSLWALPFAFLVVLTAMSSFDPVLLDAAYTLGASPLRAFVDVELPFISSGLVGAALFSFILSLNETIRTQLVQGPLNTVQTYIWSRYLQVGVSPTLYALMSLFLLVTLTLLAVFALVSSVKRQR